MDEVGGVGVHDALAALVERLAVARGRRAGAAPEDPWVVRFDAVLAALRADHGPAAAEDAAEAPAAQLAGDPSGRLTSLREAFALDPVDLELLVVAAAADLDLNVASAYGLLAGTSAASRATVAVALELAGLPTMSPEAHRRLGAASPLVRHGLVEVAGAQPWLARELRVPDRVVAHLVGDDAPDPVVAAALGAAVPVELGESQQLAKALDAGTPLAWIRSPLGTPGAAIAAGGLRLVGRDVLSVDLARCATDTDVAPLVRAALREAGLTSRGLVVLGAARLGAPEHVPLLEVLHASPVPVVAVADRAWDARWAPWLPFPLDAPRLTPSVRAELWREALGPWASDAGATELAALRLTPEEIAAAVASGSALAAARGEDLSLDVVREAARRLGTTGSQRLAPRVAATFDDLVLPRSAIEPLHRLVGWARRRDAVLAQGPLQGKGGKGTGISALFTGSPGTGKTLAAHVVAETLGLDLFPVDLSSVVDKYVGETEKNLERIFHRAESLNVVLFFDEADSMFGSRSEVRDSRDRYANLEVSYLLQRMEQFDGIVILATNLRGNLDTAFSRRLHFVVHFPDPDVATRRRLWEQHLSHTTPDAADPVDLDALAETVEVAGGDIRNVVLAAAYDAALEGTGIGHRHVLAAVAREYHKLGRRIPPGGFVAQRSRSGARTPTVPRGIGAGRGEAT